MLLGMVEHAYNPRTREAEVGGLGLETSLGYIVRDSVNQRKRKKGGKEGRKVKRKEGRKREKKETRRLEGRQIGGYSGVHLCGRMLDLCARL